MKLNHEIQIVEEMKTTKEVRTEHNFLSSKRERHNNRKNTRGRKTQYITCLIKGTFPPVFYNKTIFHA